MPGAGGSAGRAVCTAAALLMGVGTVTAQFAHDNDTTTMHAAVGAGAAGLQLLAALALLGAGVVVWFSQDKRSVGPAILGAAVAWMAPVAIVWDESPAILPSTAAATAPFLLPCLVDIATGFPDRGARDPLRRALVTAAYVVTSLYVVIRAAVYDPFLDPDCWASCEPNTFSVWSAPEIVSALESLWRVVVVVIGALLVLATARAMSRGTARPSLTGPVVAAATVAGVTQALRAVLSPGPEDPRRELLQTLFLVEAVSLVALAVALCWATWRREQLRAVAMSRLTEAASEAAGIHSLTAALALATRRPDIELAYWVPSAGRHVDASGQPLAVGPTDGDVSVLRGDSPVALIRTNGPATSAALVAEALGPAARLALDNERLRAEEMYNVQRVAESRERILAASDLARRELERDLHDGAQQRLLAVMYSLQLAASGAHGSEDPLRGAALDGAVHECREALSELRDLAHGIFPAILDTAGLADALADLGDTARVVMSVDDRTDRDLPGPVAHAAYLAVASAIAAAAEDGPGTVRVRLEDVGEHLVVTVVGAPPTRDVRTCDRVSTLGGRVFTGPDGLRVEIPCA